MLWIKSPCISTHSPLHELALISFPREQVAPLAGENWLKFLNRTCDNCDFTTDPGRLLGSASYARPDASPVAEAELRRLLQLARHWIKHPHATAPETGGRPSRAVTNPTLSGNQDAF